MEQELNEPRLKASEETFHIPQYYMFEGIKYKLFQIVPDKNPGIYYVHYVHEAEEGIVSITFKFKL